MILTRTTLKLFSILKIKQAHSCVYSSIPKKTNANNALTTPVFQIASKKTYASKTQVIKKVNPDTISIFIADDNEINRLLLKSQLESYCNTITLAKDGKEAQAYLLNNPYDLILLDLKMPYLSGLELLNIIKTKNCINKDSPVIAITAHTQNNQQIELINAGFDECLIKPILLEPLIETLNLWLPNLDLNDALPQKGNDYIIAMLEKTAGNKQFATTLFNKLFTELPEQTKNIETALKANNLELARQITHYLHGSVGFCGFIELQSKANNLENSLSENNNELINKHFLTLKTNIIDFMAQKTDILDELG